MRKLYFFITIIFAFIFIGCSNKYTMDLQDQTTAFLVTSGTNVSVTCGGEKNNRKVGLFYFNWLGQHPDEQSAIYDNEKLLNNSAADLWSSSSEKSPLYQYHYWGEPLYGYYSSTDKWVIRRHIELFIALGIDFLGFDATNGVLYDNAYKAFFEVWDEFYLQGFRPPKIVFLTHSSSKKTVEALYDNYYTNSSNDKYWYYENEKPLIITDKSAFDKNDAKVKLIMDKLNLRAVQWPDMSSSEKAFPWMSFEYPQFNHGGTMSISPAQHVSGKMSLLDANQGRGYDFIKKINISENAIEGTNYQSQWNNAINDKNVDTAFITGFNEWIALKFPENYGNKNDIYFVDQFNFEYSRDIEPSKQYGDSFLLQTAANIKRFKFDGSMKNNGTKNTLKITDNVQKLLDNKKATVFLDLAGDNAARNSVGAVPGLTYHTEATQNDITGVAIANNSSNLFVLVECADKIIDKLNIAVVCNSGRYVVNSNAIIYKNANIYSEAKVTLMENKILFAIPLNLLGNDKQYSIKAFNGEEHLQDLDFYGNNDVAPTGNFYYNYTIR